MSRKLCNLCIALTMDTLWFLVGPLDPAGLRHMPWGVVRKFCLGVQNLFLPRDAAMLAQSWES